MIKKYSLIALQTAINSALALDDTMPEKIAALHGKRIEIVVTPLDLHFFITFEKQQLLLLDRCSEHPDTVIYSNPLGLIRLSFLPASQARSLFNDKIRLSGDTELGYQVKKLFDELDIDWEGHLARFTGDVIAHQLGSFVKRGLAFKKDFTHSMQHNVSHYLHEELRLFPGREEIDDFFRDIDELGHDVERLAARINLLATTYEID
ncbi:ubiquinone biosynthesis accessory factor UbiJ [Legionella erythra]|uniref:Ubiquinone biosynthesis accessory factor UbiJ n=1 Tax=Legionella erythra TaxID=448 RepID=A0A0W0TSJ3_LEGER|nr:SCP2 sterol-binding domain-containing protein [Legionella erythra]KTC98583.1 SCP-2 sterol transfer family protein [Legionella erythra]